MNGLTWIHLAAGVVALSFFPGQQDVLPQAVRGSPILFVLAFAPFALTLFWLVRVRLSKVGQLGIGQLNQRPSLPAQE